MTNANHTYHTLREQYPEFVYHGYSLQKESGRLKVQYDFELPGFCHFMPWMEFPERPFIKTCLLNEEQLDHLLFHIGMIELISYWKATCSPVVRIESGLLDEHQIKWWKHLYFQGLGEFFYVNGIDADPENFVQIICGSAKRHQPFSLRESNEILVPIGGGKDSVVTLELLKGNGFPVRPLIMNPRGATISTAAVGGFVLQDCLVINRTIDQQLLRLNEQGFLNGHTPFSAMLAFYSLLAGALTGSGYIALSNEASANEATIKGTQINHQYSKSYEFEKDFREYVARYICTDLQYFSFLRPLHEIQIARLFSRYPAYFPVFKSCNVGSKTDVWCGSCAKCLFAYIILSPFIEKETMISIFGHDLLDDLSLVTYLDELTGISENKPFECIGTVEEVNLALSMTAEKRKELPSLLAYYRAHASFPSLQSTHSSRILEETGQQHFLNDAFLNVIKMALHG